MTAIAENYRLKKMASFISKPETKNVIDLGCADRPNPHLKCKNLVGFDLKEDSNLTSNYTNVLVLN